MLTTTVDGLWVLQVLSGIETLAPELGLRPYLPSGESTALALSHPITRELRAAGAINPDNSVDETLLEWLTVISRRDIALLMTVQTPAPNGVPDRILLGRFARWWVALESSGITIRLSAAGTATDHSGACQLINSHIERLCGTMQPAEFRPISLELAPLLEHVRDRPGLHAFLGRQCLDAEQLDLLMRAADSEVAAQASLIALQSGVTGAPNRTQIERGAVTIIDTPSGRLVAEHINHTGRSWLLLSPGSERAISGAVTAMLSRLPARDEWHSLRKVV